MHASKKLWQSNISREKMLTAFDRLIDKAGPPANACELCLLHCVIGMCGDCLGVQAWFDLGEVGFSVANLEGGIALKDELARRGVWRLHEHRVIHLIINREANIFRGVLPDESFGRHAEAILESSFMLIDGIDIELYRGGHDNTSLDDIRRFMKLFNGNWQEPVPQHFCCKPTDRSCCCNSPADAKTKMKAAFRSVCQPLWSRVSQGATKKWCEPARAAAGTSLLANCHNSMKAGTAPWRKGVADDDSGSDVRADEDPSRSRKKREKKAGLFWGRRATSPVLLALSIVTSPVRKFLAQVFCAERNARLYSAGGKVTEKVISSGLGPPEGHTYVGSFVMKGGHIDTTAAGLKKLLSDQSPLMRCSLFGVAEGSEEADELLSRHRGMVLRGIGSFESRVRKPLQKKDSFYGLLAACEAESAAEALEIARAFNASLECDADEMFVGRMRVKARRAAGTPEDYLLAQGPLMTWAGNTPPLLTICDMETGHANFSNCLKAKGFAQTGPGAVLEDTLLQRWRNTVEDRNLLEIDRIVASKQGSQNKPKRNQYSAGGPGHMVHEVNSIVESTVGKWGRRRVLPPALRPSKLGSYLFFEQCKVREAKARAVEQKWSWQQWQDFRGGLRDEWGNMNNNAKMRYTTDKNAAAAGRPHQARNQEHQRKRARVLEKTLHAFGTSSRPLTESLLDKYVKDVEGYDHIPGRYSGGIRTLETSSKKMAVQTSGCKAFHEFCLQREDVGFDSLGLSSRRSHARTCDEKHPGLCVTANKTHFRKAHKLGKHIFRLVRALKKPVGEILVRIKHPRRRAAQFYWTTRLLGNPAHLFLLKAVELGNGHIDIKEPFEHATNYSVALELVKDAAGILEEAWDFSSVVHRSPDAEPLSRTTLVGIGTVAKLSMEKPHVDIIENDPLEASLHAALTVPVAKRRRRMKAKQKEESTDTNNGSIDEESDSESFVVGTPAPDAASQRASVAVSSHFAKEIGIRLAERRHPGRASCRICSSKIVSTQVRLVWQWHTKRPHAYLHASCAHRLSAPEDSQAFEKLKVLAEEDSLADDVANEVAGALRMLAKKLPQATLPYVAW